MSQEEEDLGWDLWDKDVQSDTAMPRLTGLGRSQLERVRGDVTRMVLDSEEEGTVDWQGVTDLVVKRYSQSLHLLHTNERVRGSRLEYAEVVAGLVRPFIDVTARDGGQETRAKNQMGVVADEGQGRCSGSALAFPTPMLNRHMFDGLSDHPISTMILPQVHLQKPCYEFSFL